MADIEDQLVCRCIENGMDRERQLHDTQPRPQVATRNRNHIDDFVAHFICELFQFRPRAAFKVGRRIDCIQQTIGAGVGHSSLSSIFELLF